MDVDSVIEQDEWLPILLDVMDEHQAGAVTAAEHWNGTAINGQPFKSTGAVHHQHRTAGAGVLYDRNVGAKWDPYLGETYGYIGRELEDVDFAFSIMERGSECVYTDKVAFNHAWHKSSDWDSVEFALWAVVDFFTRQKWKLPVGPARDDYFKLVHPLPTPKFEKNHDLDGISLEEARIKIYGDLVEYWGGNPSKMPIMDDCFPWGHRGPVLTTPEERGVKDVWSERYQEVKPRSPK